MSLVALAQQSTVVSTRGSDLSPERAIERAGLKPGALIVELTDGCNMRCPTCSASSDPNLEHRPYSSIIEELSRVTYRLSLGGTPTTTVMLSGGEPTVHPEIDAIIQWCGEHLHGSEVVLITNGVRLALEPGLARVWRAAAPNLSVYLQFDSLSAKALVDIRGEDVSHIRVAALKALAAAKLPTNLVVVVKPGVSDSNFDALLQVALDSEVVTGITFQPIRAVGRTIGYDPARVLHDVDVIEFLRRDLEWVEPEDFHPHPHWPGVVTMAIYDRRSLRSRNEPSSWDSLSPGLDDLDSFRLQVLRYIDAGTVYWHNLAAAPLQVLTTDGGSSFPIDWKYLSETPEVPLAITRRTS